jgi:flagellar basal body-associated protein FliL
MEAEERMMAETGPEERSSKVLTWFVIITTLVLAVVVGMIVFDHAAKTEWIGATNKKAWDVLEVLLVPVAVGLATIWFTEEQNRRQRKDEAAQQESQRQAEKAQRERELEVENQRAQDAALHAYLDKMSELVLDKELHKKRGRYDPTRVTARARTLVALAQLLDRERKRSIVQFLYEVQLINTEDKPKLDDASEFQPRLVGLSGADLKHANLRYLTLEYAALDGAILENADLRDAELSNVDLAGSYLSGADLSRANLSGASLVDALLQSQDDLNLSGANLNGASLTNADLSGANLHGAKGVAEEQLAECRSLKGATMPDGSKHP